MAKSTVDRIYDGQIALADEDFDNYHKLVGALIDSPDTVIVGCVDARKPIAKLGGGHGGAFLHRVPGAFLKNEESIGVTLELGIRASNVKDIVVMGHTDCRAIKACLHQNTNLPRTLKYLSPLNGERDKIFALHGTSETAARQLEEEGVRQSLKQLLKDPDIADAVGKGEVRLHGWILDLEKAKAEKPFLDALALPKKVSAEAIDKAPFKSMVDLARERQGSNRAR